MSEIEQIRKDAIEGKDTLREIIHSSYEQYRHFLRDPEHDAIFIELRRIKNRLYQNKKDLEKLTRTIESGNPLGFQVLRAFQFLVMAENSLEIVEDWKQERKNIRDVAILEGKRDEKI